MDRPSVLIVGAGPTGLVLALWLTKLGVPVRIIDKTAGPGTTSRALAVQARTLELYNQLDLADAVVSEGYAVPGARLWLAGRERARVPFEEIVSDLTPYGFLHIFPQDRHERLLIARLGEFGVEVERSTELVGFSEVDDRIQARLRGPNGRESEIEAAYLTGCDGARSTVRGMMGVGFPGGTYPQVFYVADVEGQGPAFNGDLNIDLDDADFLAVFPLAERGRVRLIGAIRPDEGHDVDKLTFEDISGRAIAALQLRVEKVNWFSTYRVHHRVTDGFRRGRAFLLGDAAHIHTPVGGQGMNTGIGDAINLAWKLEAVLAGRAGKDLLDTYEAERRAFALRLVATTDRVFNLAAAEGRIASLVRTRLAPLVLPEVIKIEAVRERIFRTVSQLTLNYRGKGLDKGHAGDVRGGDRMPWTTAGGLDNYEALKEARWQVHVYGTASRELTAWCQTAEVPLRVYPWQDAMRDAGLRQDALYLVRPDTYVAVASPEQDVQTLTQFLQQAGLDLRRPS